MLIVILVSVALISSFSLTQTFALEDIKMLFEHDRMDSIGNFIISGEIQNTGTTDMKFLKIIAHLYDSKNQTIAVEDTYADENLIKPNDTSLFDLYIGEDERKSNDINSYRLSFRWSHIPGQYNNENLSISLDNINIMPINDELRFQIAFDVHNPNRDRAYLENITYDAYIYDQKISSGDIGSEVLGFGNSLSSVYTLLGNQEITLRSGDPLTKEGLNLFDFEGNYIGNLKNISYNSTNNTTTDSFPTFNINGTYTYRLNSMNGGQPQEHTFRFSYPL